MDGCGEKCAEYNHHLLLSDIWTAHRRFHHLGALQQRQWVLDYFHSNSNIETKETRYLVNGKHVCLPVWLAILNLSKTRFYEIRKAFLDGVLFFERVVSPKARQGKSYTAVAWMQKYFEQVGDQMPHRMAVHLPSFMTQSSIYNRMKEDLEKSKQEMVCAAQFYKLWQMEFQHVTIPKENRFTKCDTCTLVKSELQVTTEPKMRQMYTRLLDDHNKLQMDQRARYYNHRERARHEPHKYLSLIIDGMDQNKTDLPHLLRKNKSACNMWVMRTHVTGALAHGRRSFAFVDLHLWPQDSNLSANILLQILLKLIPDGKLPPTLYLQLDNCYRENKNQFFFGFIALLVHLKVFKEIQLGFLMVGHTHEDIDQFFSKLSQYLKYNAAHTLPDFLSAITRCYQDVPEAHLVDHVFDLKSWLEPHQWKLHNHSHPHIFRFSRDIDGIVVMHYKDWDKSNWEPTNSGIKLFKSIPEDTPKLVTPSLDRLDIEKLTLHASQYRIKCGISESAQSWWSKHLTDLKSLTTSIDSHDWPMQYLIDAASSVDDTVQMDCLAPGRDIEESQLPEHVLRVYQKEIGPHPQVYAGTKPKSGSKKKSKATSGPSDPSPSEEKNDDLSIEVGGLIAFCCPHYNERPQIAEVLSIINDRKVQVRWFDGSWTKKWSVYKYRLNKKMVPWDEDVKKEHIIMTNIKLTPRGILSAKSSRDLKKLYSN